MTALARAARRGQNVSNARFRLQLCEFRVSRNVFLLFFVRVRNSHNFQCAPARCAPILSFSHPPTSGRRVLPLACVMRGGGAYVRSPSAALGAQMCYACLTRSTCDPVYRITLFGGGLGLPVRSATAKFPTSQCWGLRLSRVQPPLARSSHLRQCARVVSSELDAALLPLYTFVRTRSEERNSGAVRRGRLQEDALVHAAASTLPSGAGRLLRQGLCGMADQMTPPLTSRLPD